MEIRYSSRAIDRFIAGTSWRSLTRAHSRQDLLGNLGVGQVRATRQKPCLTLDCTVNWREKPVS